MAKQAKLTITIDPASLTAMRSQLVNTFANIPVSVSDQSLKGAVAKLQGGAKTVASSTSGGSANPGQNINQLIAQQRQLINSSGQTSNAINQIAVSSKKAGEEVKTFGERLGFTTSRLAAYIIPATVFYKITESIASASSKIVDIDRQINKLSQSFGNNSKIAQDVAQKVIAIGQDYGQSADEVLKLTNALSRTDLYKTQQDLVKAVNIFASASLTSGFESIADHVEDMTALLASFNETGADTAKVLDAIAKISSKSGVGANELIDAAKFAGPAVAGLGGTSEQFIALIGATKELTRRSTTSVSSAFSTITTSLLKPENLSYLQQFTGGKVLDDNGKPQDLNTILREISKAASGKSENELNNLVKKLGGPGESSIVLALIKDLQKGKDSTLNQYQGFADNSSGTIIRNAAEAQKTLSVQLKSVSTAFEEAFRNIGESKGLHDLVALFASLGKEAAVVVGYLGPLLPILTAFAAVKLAQLGVRNVPDFLTGFSKNAASVSNSFIRSNGGKVNYNDNIRNLHQVDALDIAAFNSLSGPDRNSKRLREFYGTHGNSNVVQDNGEFYYLKNQRQLDGTYSITREVLRRKQSLGQQISEKFQNNKLDVLGHQNDQNILDYGQYTAKGELFSNDVKQSLLSLDKFKVDNKKKNTLLQRNNLRQEIDNFRVRFNDKKYRDILYSSPQAASYAINKHANFIENNNSVDPKYLRQAQINDPNIHILDINKAGAKLQSQAQFAQGQFGFDRYFSQNKRDDAVKGATAYTSSPAGIAEFAKASSLLTNKMNLLTAELANLLKLSQQQSFTEKDYNDKKKKLTLEINELQSAIELSILDEKAARAKNTLGGKLSVASDIISDKLSSGVNKAGSILKDLAPQLIPLTLAGIGTYISDNIDKSKQDYKDASGDTKSNAYNIILANQSKSTSSSSVGSASSLGLTGALIGSTIAPVLGTIIGGAIGVIIGSIGGYFTGLSSSAKEATEQLLELASSAKGQSNVQKAIKTVSDTIFTKSFVRSRLDAFEDNFLGAKSVIDFFSKDFGLTSIDQSRRERTQSSINDTLDSVNGQLYTNREKQSANKQFLELTSKGVNSHYAALQVTQQIGEEITKQVLGQDANSTTPRTTEQEKFISAVIDRAVAGLGEVAKSIQEFNDALKNGAAGFDKFFGAFNIKTKSIQADVLNGQVLNNLSSQNAGVLFGSQKGTTIPTGLGASLLADINNGVENGGDIKSLVYNKLGGTVDAGDLAPLTDAFKIKQIGADLLKKTRQAIAGRITDQTPGGDLSGIVAREFAKTFNPDDIKKLFGSAEGRSDAAKLSEAGQATINKEGIQGILHGDSNQFTTKTLGDIDIDKSIEDRLNAALGLLNENFQKVNQNLQIYTTLSGKANEIQQKETSFTISRLKDSRAIGATDRDIIDKLNEAIAKRQSPDLSGKLANLKTAANNYGFAYNADTNAVNNKNIGSVNPIQNAKAVQDSAIKFGAEQEKVNFALERTNNTLALTREKFEALNKVVEDNINSNKKIGQLSFGDNSKLQLYGSQLVTLFKPLDDKLKQYGIKDVRGLAGLGSDARKDILGTANIIGGNPIVQRLLQQVGGNADNRLTSSGATFGSEAGIAQFAHGLATNISGLTDDSSSSLTEISKAFELNGSLEQQQLDTLKDIYKILEDGFAGNIKQFGAIDFPSGPTTPIATPIVVPDIHVDTKLSTNSVGKTPISAKDRLNAARDEFNNSNNTNDLVRQNAAKREYSSAIKNEHTMDIKANVNISGFENAGKHIAAVAVMTTILDEMSKQLSQTGDSASSDLATIFTNTSRQLTAGLNKGSK